MLSLATTKCNTRPSIPNLQKGLVNHKKLIRVLWISLVITKNNYLPSISKCFSRPTSALEHLSHLSEQSCFFDIQLRLHFLFHLHSHCINLNRLFSPCIKPLAFTLLLFMHPFNLQVELAYVQFLSPIVQDFVVQFSLTWFYVCWHSVLAFSSLTFLASLTFSLLHFLWVAFEHSFNTFWKYIPFWPKISRETTKQFKTFHYLLHKRNGWITE